MNTKDMLAQLRGHRVLVLGDVMLDRYLNGQVTRISPEAPVPVVLQDSVEDRLGGAANVALNLHALGAVPILCSVCGNDHDGELLRRLLPDNGLSAEGIVESSARRTTVKTRILGNHQQMLRIDQEDTHDLDEQETNDLLERLRRLIHEHEVSALIFQDYNKGVLSEAVINGTLKETSRHKILTAVDPKKHNFFAYRGVDLFKPNLKEIRDSLPFPVHSTPDSLDQAASFLQQKLENRLTMITLSEKGLYLNDGNTGHIYPTTERAVADVSGAGDTVISIAALALVAGLSLEWVAALSNLAGGQVCEFRGVVPVNVSLLEAEINHWVNK